MWTVGWDENVGTNFKSMSAPAAGKVLVLAVCSPGRETQLKRKQRALLIIINDTGRCGRIGMENRPEVGSGGSYCSGARPLFRRSSINMQAVLLRRAATWWTRLSPLICWCRREPPWEVDGISEEGFDTKYIFYNGWNLLIIYPILIRQQCLHSDTVHKYFKTWLLIILSLEPCFYY